jgi:serine/threonine protein phosphatase 1
MNYVISDIHGCGNELQQLVERILGQDSGAQFYLVGDLFDRGYEPHLVWELIMKHRMQSVLGNHERKLEKFLSGERQDVPVHYHWALHRMARAGIDINAVRSYISELPLNIVMGLHTLPSALVVIAHAGVLPHAPTQADVSGNVYGIYKPRDWWDIYEESGLPNLVIYGHLSQIDHSVRYRKNSVGIDTAACHDGYLTAYCIETKEIIQIKPLQNWFGKLKQEIKSLGVEKWILAPNIANP